MTVPHTSVIEVTPTVKLQNSKSECWLEDSASQTVIKLNESAKLIWLYCQEGFSYTQIVDSILCMIPGVAALGVWKSTADCLLEFYNLGLIRWCDIEIVSKDFKLPKEPVSGISSEKAHRLVQYCLGMFRDQPITPCSENLDYARCGKTSLFRVYQTHARLCGLSDQPGNRPRDQKQIVNAWMKQNALLPDGSCCWIVRGDESGNGTDPTQGVHVGMVRHHNKQHVILVPSSNRNRLMGPLLAQQIVDIKEYWTPWEEKYDSVFWGGAGTGPGLDKSRKEELSRSRVLDYFHRNPSPQVQLHLVGYPSGRLHRPHEELGKFRKHDALKHKCLLILKGNDIPSGLTWGFCGNSLVLMQPPKLECILHFELEPWVHYVPVESDPADILVKLHWVLENQAMAREIVNNAHEHLRWLTGSEYLWSCNEVLRRIGAAK